MSKRFFKCLSCGFTESELFFQNCEDYYLRKPFNVDYVRCSQCDLVQVAEVPAEVSSFYDAYPIHARKSSIYERVRRWVMAPAYLNPLLLNRGDVLVDYGCGDGWFLESCKSRGARLVGVERSPEQAKLLSTRLGLPVYSDLNSLAFDLRARVDFLTLHFVLEHLTDISSPFEQATQLLKPGGVLFFTVPNINSWEAKLFRRKWHGLDPPRHISFPNHSTVKRLAAKYSLEVAGTKHVPFPNGFAGSVPNILVGHFDFRLYVLSLPLGILISRLAPYGAVSFTLRKIRS